MYIDLSAGDKLFCNHCLEHIYSIKDDAVHGELFEDVLVPIGKQIQWRENAVLGEVYKCGYCNNDIDFGLMRIERK